MNTALRGVDEISPSCLPVTALEIVRYETRPFLLYGFGSSLGVSPLHSAGTSSISRRVFASQAIHGIVTGITNKAGELTTVCIVVWGGRLLALCHLHIWNGARETETETSNSLSLEVVWSTTVDDWILSSTTLYGGSVAVLLTAHNVLHRLPLIRKPLAKPSAFLKGPQTLLYSGHVLVTEKNSILVASGSVFGEIVVWQCWEENGSDVWCSNTAHTFFGHRGSVFGVRLSERFDIAGCLRRLLASCSDDRTVRIWDVSDCVDEPLAPNKVQQAGRNTGFGGVDTDSQSIGMAWGHLSRIWDISFIQHGSYGEQSHVTILSRGEDGACHQWELDKLEVFDGNHQKPVRLHHVYGDHQHAGKNAWSWTNIYIEGACLVLTGGADGQIAARKRQPTSRMELSKHESVSFRDVLVSSGSLPSPSPHAKKSTGLLKQYLSFDDGNLVATTSTGHLLKSQAHDLSTWSVVASDKSGSTIVLGGNVFDDLAFFGWQDGQIAVFDNQASKVEETLITLPAQATCIMVAGGESTLTSTVNLVVTISRNHLPRFISVAYPRRSFLAPQSVELQLPSDFIITSAEYHAASQSLICGSRQGAVAVFHHLEGTKTSAEPTLCVRHVHGSDCVTSVKTVAHEIDSLVDDRYILTTGRDGTYAMHLVDRQHNFSTVHRSVPEFGPYIEGVYLSKGLDGNLSVVLYGFKSTDFIVWDETRQKLLFSVDCGGAHRNWAFNAPGSSTNRRYAFVWTKAGTVNSCLSPYHDDFIVREGGHGREIKTLAILPLLQDEHETLIATGAEDTDIRLFRYRRDASVEHKRAGFRCVRQLVGHTAGIQHLKFSACGKFLLSSAGREELFVWSISRVPLLELGSVLLARLPRDVDDGDARIMSFDVVEVDQNSEGYSVEIWMAFSNGKLRHFSYSDSGRRFVLIEDHTLGMICLTQVAMLAKEQALVGATDGRLRIVEQSSLAVNVRNTSVHQSNISAMAIEKMRSGWTLVATGGDDNAFGVTILTNHEEHWAKTYLVPAAHAAAVTALGVLETSVDTGKTISVVATAGNDQRVKIWRVEVRIEGHDVDGDVVDGDAVDRLHDEQNSRQIHVQGIDLTLAKLGEYWTDVADISDIGILPSSKTKTKIGVNSSNEQQWQLLVVGVGMQVLDIVLPSR